MFATFIPILKIELEAFMASKVLCRTTEFISSDKNTVFHMPYNYNGQGRHPYLIFCNENSAMIDRYIDVGLYSQPVQSNYTWHLYHPFHLFRYSYKTFHLTVLVSCNSSIIISLSQFLLWLSQISAYQQSPKMCF